MKNINLTKYGFEKLPNVKEENCDCFRVGKRIKVYKTVDHDSVWIFPTLQDGELFYEEFSKLPHYNCLSALNYVKKHELTDNDFIKLYNDCLAYEQEYEEAENKIIYPTIEEIRQQCIRINNLRQKELEEIEKLFKKVSFDFITKSDISKVRLFKDYFDMLSNKVYNLEKFPKTFHDTLYGRNFVKDTNPDLVENWKYKKIIELLKPFEKEE